MAKLEPQPLIFVSVSVTDWPRLSNRFLGEDRPRVCDPVDAQIEGGHRLFQSRDLGLKDWILRPTIPSRKTRKVGQYCSCPIDIGASGCLNTGCDVIVEDRS